MLLLHTGAAHAVLIDRGGGLIYDTDLNVTWMQDAQFELTTGAASPGMSWREANAWAADLEYYDPARGTILKDWRLPRTINLSSSSSFDTTGTSSELTYMYYVNLGDEANLTLGALLARRASGSPVGAEDVTTDRAEAYPCVGPEAARRCAARDADQRTMDPGGPWPPRSCLVAPAVRTTWGE